MNVSENGENIASDINLMDFPFICRICLRPGDLRLFEQEDYLWGLFETITKIDVRSTVNFPSNICRECINKLEDISLFIDISKYNNSKPGNNIIPKKENEYVAIVDFGMSQEPVVKTEKTAEQYEEDICTEKSEFCRICLVPSCLTPFEEKAHLMQLFQTITNIKFEAASNSSSRNSLCNECINKLESISLFISLSLSSGMKIESTIGRNESRKTENYSGEKAIFNISDRKEVKVENYFNGSVCSYESKDLHIVVDIKEEILHCPEAPIMQNDQKGLEFCGGTDSVEKLECDPCEEEFSSENHLQKIISEGKEACLAAHPRTKQFKCDFNLKNGSKRHSLVDSKKISFKCDTGEKTFKCDSCGKSFNQKHTLKRHMLTHTGEKLFKCDICEKSFSQKPSLKIHNLTHTGEKLFKCHNCNKGFSQKSSLQQHMLTHTAEKLFDCDICKRSFTLVHHLKRHMLTHTGEKPFQCDICKKSYTLAHSLKRHIPTHTGQKFKCKICGKSFPQSSGLKKHMLIHTGEKTFIYVITGNKVLVTQAI